jgi:predicted TIM-barrel enzyme
MRSKPRVLPVIHVRDRDQALENAQIAAEAGADGVFLISHGSHEPLVLARLGREVKRMTYSTMPWVGINFLGLEPVDAIEMLPTGIDGLWVDNAGIDEHAENQYIADEIEKVRQQEMALRSFSTRMEYFGGVAFKYQRPVRLGGDLKKAAEIARNYMDVVTTSGEGTGKAADLDKIREMREGLGPDARLGIASGITPENVELYLPYVNDFLVATGINKDFFNFDPNKLRELVKKVHGE